MAATITAAQAAQRIANVLNDAEGATGRGVYTQATVSGTTVTVKDVQGNTTTLDVSVA